MLPDWGYIKPFSENINSVFTNGAVKQSRGFLEITTRSQNSHIFERSSTIAAMQIHQPVITTNGSVRATWVEVNLSRLTKNLQAIRAHVAPAKVMIIVKANAYGHGLAEVA